LYVFLSREKEKPTLKRKSNNAFTLTKKKRIRKTHIKKKEEGDIASKQYTYICLIIVLFYYVLFNNSLIFNGFLTFEECFYEN